MKSIQLYAILSLSVVFAEQWYQITPEWKVNQTQLDLFTSKLERTTNDTYMYHWGDGFSGLRYAKQNYVDQEEMDFLNSGDGVGGGGFYVSTDKYDSNIYGNFPTAVRIPTGTLLFNSCNNSETMSLVKILGYPNNYLFIQDKVALGAVVPFLDDYNCFITWRVTHSAKVLQEVMPGHVAPVPYNVGFWSDRSPMPNQFVDGAFDILNKTKHTKIFDSWKDNIEEIERLFSLLTLLGVTEMNCRLGLQEDIWQSVDRQQFDGFHKLRMHVYKMIKNNIHIGFGTFYYGIQEDLSTTALDWARNQTEKVLPELHNIAYGSVGNMWRGEERTVHIGNGTISVVDQQLKYIESNPYLHVKRVSTDGNHTQVQIWLPDVLHYNKTLVSNTTDALIKSYSVAQIESDTMLRQKLNRVLNKDMLEHMMVNVFSVVYYDVDLCKQLAYLSPLTDTELAKMWCYLGAVGVQHTQNALPPDVLFRGIEVLLNPKTDAIDLFYNDLRRGSFNIFGNITLSTVLSMGDHIHKPEDNGWFTNGWNTTIPYAGLHFVKNFLLPVDKCEMMRQKKWTEVLDEVSPNWLKYL